MKRPEVRSEIARAAVLDEPVRWALYAYVSKRRRDVGRDEAARALKISRALAAFHLDKLVEEGLLETTYRRLSGRNGPGAGRPAKLYRRSAQPVAVNLPPRSYDLAGLLLLKAVAASGSQAAVGALHTVAADLGFTIGTQARRNAGARADRLRVVNSAMAALSGYGFEPVRTTGGDIRLNNCPFHALAQEYRDLICGMNLALMQGLVRGLRLRGLSAELEPEPDRCCVVFHRRPA